MEVAFFITAEVFGNAVKRAVGAGEALAADFIRSVPIVTVEMPNIRGNGGRSSSSSPPSAPPFSKSEVQRQGMQRLFLNWNTAVS